MPRSWRSLSRPWPVRRSRAEQAEYPVPRSVGVTRCCARYQSLRTNGARRQTWARTDGWPWRVFANLHGAPPGERALCPPCGAVWRGYCGEVRLVPVGPDRGSVAPDPGDASPERCARKTPRRKERRREQHPRFLPGRPAAPQPQMGCLLPSILRRPAFGHWRCGCERWVCSTAGPATTG